MSESSTAPTATPEQEATTAAGSPATGSPATGSPAASATSPAATATSPPASALSGRSWWGVFGVAVALLVAWATFTFLLLDLADNSSSNAEVWGRYIYIFSGFEAVVFVAVGWLFGREVNRGAADQAQKSADTATQAANQAKQEAAAAKREAATNAEDAAKGRALAAAVESAASAPGATFDFQPNRDVSGTRDQGQPMDSAPVANAQLASLQQLASKLFPTV